MMDSISDTGKASESAKIGSNGQTLPIRALKEHFPIFRQHPQLVYLDSAATSQRPDMVIDRVNSFYQRENANVHRGVYGISESATLAFEQVRLDVAAFLGEGRREEVLFTSGATEGLNLAAHVLESNLNPGDEILIPLSEHHSNIVPWQILARRKGIILKFIPLTEHFRIDLDAAAAMVTAKTKIISCAHVSNVTGIIHPLIELTTLAHSVGAVMVVDGAQATSHLVINVKEIGCDFYAFSSHKMMGPTGTGVLFGKKQILEQGAPYKGGGDMIQTVTTSGFTCNELPHKYEAGTPNIAGIIGLGAAIKFLQACKRQEIRKHEYHLGLSVYNRLKDNKKVRIFCYPGDDWLGVVSFFHQDIHPHDLASIAGGRNVCIRAGHHCAQPLMQHWQVPATSRVSPFLYNTEDDIEMFFLALGQAERLFQSDKK